MSKIYPHLSNEADIQAMARLTPYQTAEADTPKRVKDWQPWVVVGVVMLIVAVSCFFAGRASAQNLSLKQWFNNLRSEGGGVCCYDYDGVKLAESDWKGGQTYSVIIDGNWVTVPPDRVVQEPNRLQMAFEWHYYNAGEPVVRCFIPGNMG